MTYRAFCENCEWSTLRIGRRSAHRAALVHEVGCGGYADVERADPDDREALDHA